MVELIPEEDGVVSSILTPGTLRQAQCKHFVKRACLAGVRRRRVSYSGYYTSLPRKRWRFDSAHPLIKQYKGFVTAQPFLKELGWTPQHYQIVLWRFPSPAHESNSAPPEVDETKPARRRRVRLGFSLNTKTNPDASVGVGFGVTAQHLYAICFTKTFFSKSARANSYATKNIPA